MQNRAHAPPAHNRVCLVPTPDLAFKTIENGAGARSPPGVDGDRDRLAASERLLDLGRRLTQAGCGDGLSHVDGPHPVILPKI
jgi:hypothetical protein